MAELHLQLFDLHALSAGAVEMRFVEIVGVEDLVHARVEYSKWLDHRVRRLPDAVGAQDEGGDERGDDQRVKLKIAPREDLNFNSLL